MAFHKFFSEQNTDRMLKEIAGEYLSPVSSACFSGVAGNYAKEHGKGNLVFSVMPLIKDVELFINDFNSRMKNIRIGIFFERELKSYDNCESIRRSFFLKRGFHGDPDKLYPIASTKIYALYLDWDPSYSYHAKKYTYVPIMQLARTFNIQVPYYDWVFDIAVNRKGYAKKGATELPNLIDRFNSYLCSPAYLNNSCYGLWCTIQVNMTDFRILDEPPAMNGICGESMSMNGYGTRLFSSIHELDQRPVVSPDNNDDEDRDDYQ